MSSVFKNSNFLKRASIFVLALPGPLKLSPKYYNYSPKFKYNPIDSYISSYFLKI